MALAQALCGWSWWLHQNPLNLPGMSVWQGLLRSFWSFMGLLGRAWPLSLIIIFITNLGERSNLKSSKSLRDILSGLWQYMVQSQHLLSNTGFVQLTMSVTEKYALELTFWHVYFLFSQFWKSLRLKAKQHLASPVIQAYSRIFPYFRCISDEQTYPKTHLNISNYIACWFGMVFFGCWVFLGFFFPKKIGKRIGRIPMKRRKWSALLNPSPKTCDKFHIIISLVQCSALSYKQKFWDVIIIVIFFSVLEN